MSKTLDTDLAEELTQETFFQAIRSADRFDGSCALSTWLCAIAKNVLRTHLRKNKSHENLDDEAISGKLAAPEQEDTLARMELIKKLHTLQEPYREVMYLRVFGGLSFKEIGEVQEKSENWARVTFYRGKERLRKEGLDHE